MAERRYEIRKTERWSRQSILGFADTLADAVMTAEQMGEEEGHSVRIREYELSGMPGIRPVRPDLHFSLEEARAELEDARAELSCAELEDS